MTADTRATNRRMTQFDNHNSVWLFGYGSLIFKAGFDYIKSRPASIEGWVRRFWQGSHDHRGTPDAPGRVLTLIEQPGAICRGMGYLVSPTIFEQLDVREKNGYLRLSTPLTFDDGGQSTGLVYIATPDNDAYIGPASEAEIAARVAISSGPSGANRDYVVQLADGLRTLGYDDPHVFAIERHLYAMDANS